MANPTNELLQAGGANVPARHSKEMNDRKKKLHGQLADEAAADYRDGMPVSQLRRKYKTGIWAIRTAAADRGVALRSKGRQPRRFSESDIAEISRLYTSDWTQAQIASKFKISQMSISKILRESEAKIRGSLVGMVEDQTTQMLRFFSGYR